MVRLELFQCLYPLQPNHKLSFFWRSPFIELYDQHDLRGLVVLCLPLCNLCVWGDPERYKLNDSIQRDYSESEHGCRAIFWNRWHECDSELHKLFGELLHVLDHERVKLWINRLRLEQHGELHTEHYSGRGELEHWDEQQLPGFYS